MRRSVVEVLGGIGRRIDRRFARRACRRVFQERLSHHPGRQQRCPSRPRQYAPGSARGYDLTVREASTSPASEGTTPSAQGSDVRQVLIPPLLNPQELLCWREVIV
jgi:hypothetical protein